MLFLFVVAASVLAAPPLSGLKANEVPSLVEKTVIGGQPVDWDGRLGRLLVRFVAKRESGELTPFCSGMLVDACSVASAGHCFLKPAGQDIFSRGEVFAEVFDAKAPEQRRLVPVAEHKSVFDGPGKFDLSIAHLQECPGEKNAQYPELGVKCDPGRRYYSAGFGLTETGKSSLTPRQAVYKIEPHGGDTMIHGTAIEGKGNTCFGDSGGPILCYSLPTTDAKGNKIPGQLGIASVQSYIMGYDMIANWLFRQGRIRPEKYCETATRISGVDLDQSREQLEELRQRMPVTSSWVTRVKPNPKNRR